jgi:hypothetical protein
MSVHYTLPCKLLLCLIRINPPVFSVLLEPFVMPLNEYQALLPHQEGILPNVPHEAYACLFVPNTNSTKWYYAITCEPIFPKQKLGIVLTVDNELSSRQSRLTRLKSPWTDL